MIQRRLNRWVGAFLLVVGLGGLALSFPPRSLLAVQMVLLAVAGALLVASGVTDRVRWSLLSGLGNVALGLSLLVSGLETFSGGGSGAGDYAYAVAIGLGGLSLVAIGVLYAIEHEDVQTGA